MSCWNTIGVWGTEQPRCPSLEEVVHCRNCDVFVAAGRGVLERLQPPELLAEQTARLARPRSQHQALSQSWMVFRVGEEWLGLPTGCFEEVVTLRPIRSIPHRTGGAVLGVANFRGRLELCLSLQRLLGIGGAGQPERLLVLNAPSGRLVLTPAEQVLGTVRFPLEAIETERAGALAFVKGLVQLQGRAVGLLDSALLFEAMERHGQR